MMTGRGRIRHLVCGECGVGYASRKATQFCSRKCAATAMHKKLGPPGVLTCQTCGKVATTGRWIAGHVKYCSRECWRNRELTRPRTFSCRICGKEVRRTYQPVTAKYCSHDCRAQARRKGGSVSSQGYRVLHVAKRPVLEHRVVMEQIIGRPLLTSESVHHRNGDRLDNSPSNLELWDRSQPAGQRVDDKITWAVDFLTRWGFEVHRP